MNNSLKRLLLVLVSCLTMTFASAQETTEDAARSKAAQTTSELKATLNLTAEQQKRVLETMTYVEMKKAGMQGDKSAIDPYIAQEMNKILSENQMQVWLRGEAAKNPKVDSGAQENQHKE
jgi:uncharacterized protein (UPF0333 family)